MKQVAFFLLLALCFLGFNACTRAVIDEDNFSGPINYNPEVQNIMFNNCVTCHSGSSPAAQIALETYQEVRDQTENGNLISRMNDASNPMPPGGLITLQQREAIERWLENGLPQ